MKRTIIALDYFDRFKCIGGDCPRTCCNGWKVIIDNDTYEKNWNVTMRSLILLKKALG